MDRVSEIEYLQQEIEIYKLDMGVKRQLNQGFLKFSPAFLKIKMTLKY